MPDVPDRPGHRRAAHKAAPRFPRLRTKRSPSRSALATPHGGLRRHAGTLAALSGVLVAGIVVSGSAFDNPPNSARAAQLHKRAWKADIDAETERARSGLTQTSRSEIRTQISHLRQEDEPARRGPGNGGVSSADSLMPTDPREIALELLPRHGWDSSEFSCLEELWVGESDWEVDATNPTSGAYGIPQALPPEKMAAFGADWRTNPVTQIEWGLWYIDQSYGTPCAANEFKNANNWY